MKKLFLCLSFFAILLSACGDGNTETNNTKTEQVPHKLIDYNVVYKNNKFNETLSKKEVKDNIKEYSKLQLQVSHPDKFSSYRILGIHLVCSL
ncbi:hypothetical protein [Macrococcus brunensis]|uniref:hypothetical protein n=1 Tax=Macrococcus brunensis TaxID=198483 RepID=UPI001EEF9C5C|nr:hypothetical protein [Macrococcus brunensis]ULG74451.1 hypothetical protein MGG13_01355 [Macrococcus brunensis]